MEKITISLLIGEQEVKLTLTSEEYDKIINGDEELLRKLVAEKNINTVLQQQLVNSEDTILLEHDNTEESQKEKNEKETTFNWPEKAVMFLLELYREREHEFSAGVKRHNKLWFEIASELQKFNYNVSAGQVQNKISGLKRTYKKIKDSNAKSGNHNSTWAYYSVMDSIFGDKGWVSPPAVASSDGPVAPSVASSSSSSTCSINNFEDICNPKTKKRKVESILDSFISDLKSNREQVREERKKEQLDKEKKKEERWEVSRAENREMHKETTEIQKSLVCLLSKLIDKQNK